jgi:outer membrane protein TolC
MGERSRTCATSNNQRVHPMTGVFSRIAPVLALFLTAPPPLDPCGPGAEPEAIRLGTLWGEGVVLEPGFRAAALRVESSWLFEQSSARAFWPTLRVEGLSNYGQRVSPGEERVLGVGPRSELRIVGAWDLLDSARGSALRGLRSETDALRAEEIVRSRAWQGDRGRAFADALLAEASVASIEEHRALLGLLEDPVERRVRAGVESRFEAQLLGDALARAERRLDEARERQRTSRADLSLTVGRCVRAVPDGLDQALSQTPLGADPAPQIPGASALDLAAERAPEVKALRARAHALAARAEAQADANRWRVSLVGSIGPTRSRAFSPDPVESESLVGIQGSLRLDPAGVHRLEREAGILGALALDAEADRIEAELRREGARLDLELQGLEIRRRALLAEWEESEAALSAAVLRWRAGVGGWPPVVQAAEQRLARHLLLLDVERSLTILLLRQLELGLPAPARF